MEVMVGWRWWLVGGDWWGGWLEVMPAEEIVGAAVDFMVVGWLCEDRIGTGPPRARTEVIYEDLGYLIRLQLLLGGAAI